MKRISIGLLIVLLLALPVQAITIDVLSTDPAPLIAGEYGDVTLRISRDATDDLEKSIRFSIEETAFITPIAESDLELSLVQAGDTITHTFRLFFSEELPEGYIDLPTVISVGDAEVNEDVRVYVQEAETAPEILIGQITTTPSELLPDTEDNKLFITLQNLGDKDAELVRAEVSSTAPGVEPSFAFSFVDSVATIPAGEEKEFEYTIDLEEEARGELPARLHIRYRTEKAIGNLYETYQLSLPFGIPVADAPFLRIADVEYLDQFTAGSTENRVRVTIVNDGEEDAEEVRVRVLPDISYPFIFELTTEYVASEIAPGESATVEFRAEVVRGAVAREYQVTARLESLVGETRYSREDTLLLMAKEGRSVSTGSLGLSIIIIAGLVSVILGYRTFRSRRKKKR